MIKKYISVLLAVFILFSLTACSSNDETGAQNSANKTDTTIEVTSSELAKTSKTDVEHLIDAGIFSSRDFDASYDSTGAENIQLKDGLTISREGTYILSGDMENGIVTIDAQSTDKVQLVLDGVNINNESSAAIYIKQADKVFITLAEGSVNKLSNGGNFAEDKIDGVIFSKDDLTINGSGKLEISSPAGHGIACNDSLSITGGEFSIDCANNGLKANDDISIAGGSFEISSGKDAIQADHNANPEKGFIYISGGQFNISAEGDGLSAGGYLQVDNGDFNIISGGGYENAEKKSSDMWGQFVPGGFRGGPGFDPSNMPGDGREPPEMREDFAFPDMDNNVQSNDGSSMKAFKAKAGININGGSFKLDSADDAFHSDLSLTVNAGEFEISCGDDAFHAEETLTVNDGNINIKKSYEGLEALHIKLCGGEINIVADDDGLNAAGGVDMSGTGGRDGRFGGAMHNNSKGSIVIDGGNLNITAYGDGIDANGYIEMSGGNVIVCGPTYGDTATLDFDTTATISGGSFIGSGGTMMAQTFSEAKQGIISLSVGNQSAGTEITVIDSAGNTVCSHSPELDYAVVIISMPELVSGETYTVRIGELSGEFTA